MGKIAKEIQMPDGSIIELGGDNKLVGEVLLAEYTHQGNQEIHFSDFDWATATGTTTEPHGLTEATKAMVIPNEWYVNYAKNVNIFMTSIPIEWMKYSGAIWLLPVDENTLTIVQNDKISPIIANVDNLPSNEKINFNNFHFEIPLGYNIVNLSNTIKAQRFRVVISGAGSKYGSRYFTCMLNNDNQSYSYYVLLYETTALGNITKTYHNYIFRIEIEVDTKTAVKPCHRMKEIYNSQREGYNYFVADATLRETASNHSYNLNAPDDAYHVTSILSTTPFLSNGCKIQIYAVEGEYNES